jgi:outer membrane protein OmpA-like peptidoglycan-associated protein
MMGSVVFNFFCFLLFLVSLNQALAEDLIFPTTEDEIVAALQMKDGKTTFEGIEYQSFKGRVYKIIGGKRYRLRGLGGIVDSEIVPKVGALIHFDSNSSRIKEDSYPLLNEFGKAMQGGLSDINIIIAGHTDSNGTFEYNQKLSEDRAQAVAQYLTASYDISPERLQLKGFGEERPIGDNNSEKGRYKNRRVEFIRAD